MDSWEFIVDVDMSLRTTFPFFDDISNFFFRSDIKIIIQIKTVFKLVQRIEHNRSPKDFVGDLIENSNLDSIIMISIVSFPRGIDFILIREPIFRKICIFILIFA